MSKKAQNIENLLEELQDTLSNMSSEELSIEEAIKEYAKAAKIIQMSQQRLNEAKLEIQEIDQQIMALGDEENAI